jgi:hypothetical protein
MAGQKRKQRSNFRFMLVPSFPLALPLESIYITR